MSKVSPSYYAIIPADVRYDDKIPANAKLLYGEISALLNKEGFCFASNQYFADLYGCTTKSISRLVSALEESGYISYTLERDATGQVTSRKIRLKVSTAEEHPVDNFVYTPGQNCGEGMDKNVQYTNTSITDIYKENKKESFGEQSSNKKRSSESFDPAPSFAQFVLAQLGDTPAAREVYAALLNFANHRKAIKKPIRSQASVTALQNKLLTHAKGKPTLMIDMLDTAVSSGWQTVYPPKSGSLSPSSQQAGERKWEEL